MEIFPSTLLVALYHIHMLGRIGGASATLNTLTAGTYTLTVTDNNSCSSAIVVNLTAPAAFTFVDVATTAHCGQADGDLTITTSGGTTPYSYWGRMVHLEATKLLT